MTAGMQLLKESMVDRRDQALLLLLLDGAHGVDLFGGPPH